MSLDLNRTNVQNEISVKAERIQQLLEQHNLDALLLRRVSSFAWATCGSVGYVNTAATDGIASLLITPKGRYLLTSNIEATRLEKEEKLVEQGWEFKISPWHDGKNYIAELTDGMKLGADGYYPGAVDISDDLAYLRSQLTSEEVLRFRTLGKLCADSMRQAIDAVRPGMPEYQIAGLLSQAGESRGVQVIVNLIATDERIFAYRHPTPTDKPLQHYAMLVLCGRKWGLVCSITRFVHFGFLPREVRQKAEAVARVDAAMIATTRPGRTMSEIFKQAQAAYTDVGFPDEWQLHHQGGSAGYEAREIIATPSAHQAVLANQVYAWNPSITGTKSEDSILVGEQGNEILSKVANWPTIDIQIGNQLIQRPLILEKD
jgi:Xaa-Pro aminopeptidase